MATLRTRYISLKSYREEKGRRTSAGRVVPGFCVYCTCGVGGVVWDSFDCETRSFFFGADGDRKKRGTTVSRVGFPAALHRRLQSPYFPS